MKVTGKIILLIIVSIYVLSASAQKSYIYFQNNSSLSFSVNAVQTGTHTMDGDEWWGMTGAINPWQLNTSMLWSNRESGVHNGDDFYLTVTLNSGGEDIQLKMHLNGSFIGSDMSQSIEVPGFTDSWYSNNDYHQATFDMGGKTFTLKYTSYFTGGYDDILFVLQEHDPWPVPVGDVDNPDVLNVLSYNVFMLSPPISLSDQGTRANYIHEHISGYDIIIFNEAFDNSARSDLTDNMIAEYPYYTDVVDESGSTEDGGVIIFSRWPIEYSEDIVYDDCDAEDCLAAKGVMYARIDKMGEKYHVFGTHTQAWPEEQNVITRQAQLTQFKNFMLSLEIPENEAVIYGGDLNVDKIANHLNEYNEMFTILNAHEPDYIGGQPYTYNQDLSSYADDPELEYLDYAMYDNAHRVPDVNTNEVIVLRSIADEMWDIFDLSDHMAVHGRFVFPDTGTDINEFTELNKDITVFPNPANDFLNLKGLSSPLKAENIRLCTTQGAEIPVKLGSDNTIDLSSLQAGLYLLYILDNEKQDVVRFVKN